MNYFERSVCELPGAPEGARGTLHAYCNTYTGAIAPLPAVVICPGGAYAETSEDEGEPVALSLLASGFQAFVLHYSTAPARFPTALFELFATLRYLHDHHEELLIDPSRIVVMGFSAGAHLAGCAGILHDCPELAAQFGDLLPRLKPAAMCLSYPVISSGPYGHAESIENLTGEKGGALTDRLSLEQAVSGSTVPAFVWHTANDAVVPVQNSLLLAEAFAREGVPFELHIYPDGRHGLSLANGLSQHQNPPVSGWFADAVRFLKSQLGL